MKQIKHSLCYLLIICMTITSLITAPKTANANENDFVIENGKLISYKGTDEVVTIPDEVSIISGTAFYNNKNITELIIPENVTLCETGCFALCPSLKKITFYGKETQVNYDWIERKEQWEEGVFYPGKYMDAETYSAYQTIAKSTLTIQGYKGSTAQELAKKIVAYPYGYKAIKFVDLTTNKATTYGIKVSKNVSIKKGKSATIKITLPEGLDKVSQNPSFGSGNYDNHCNTWDNRVTVKYKSSNPNIASVNNKGKVTGKKKGTAKITVTVSWGKDDVILNNLGDRYAYKKTFTTKVTIK